MSEDRNPLIIPTVTPTRRCCPACKKENFTGRNLQGVVTFTCLECRNSWQGGLPQEPQDPTQPHPPINPKDRPLVQFVRTSSGKVEEERTRVNLTQEFRKGIPFPEGEDD